MYLCCPHTYSHRHSYPLHLPSVQRQLTANKPAVKAVADVKVVMVLLHLVLDLLIQEAQFHHENQAGHAGKPVTPYLYSATQSIPKWPPYYSHDMPTPWHHLKHISRVSPKEGSCVTHYHMKVVHEVHRQGCKLQNQLHIVHVGCLVLPVPTVVHIPEVDHISASSQRLDVGILNGVAHGMHEFSSHTYNIMLFQYIDNMNGMEVITVEVHT